jgi:glycosyltransferase involved in cell wall biosynthesis
MRVDTNAIVQVAVLGNYLPRQCGIATFTTDLTDAISVAFPEVGCEVLAMNDPGMHHAYGGRVCFQVAEGDLASYLRAADFLNLGGSDLLNVQHEYGIFGGKAGSHLLVLLRELRMPIVTTLHTILKEPSSDQRRVMDELVQLSTRLVVMSRYGAELLHHVHGVPQDKIDVIPHGIPNMERTSGSKRQLGVEGQFVILTFGLLSPDKGIEFVIEALPHIVARHPNTVYIVVGATHPHIKARTGESYRRRLALLALRLGVDSNIIFHDRFVSHTELTEFLSTADIYVTPYLNMEQITSGTLAYAVGAGKAVISSPYHYASELLAEGRGILVPTRDSGAIAAAITDLLDHPAALSALSARAAEYGRDMVWPRVAESYLETFARAKSEHVNVCRSVFKARTLAVRPLEITDVNLGHLRLMTDDTGLLQHATFAIPHYEHGYCVDDNARALILLTYLEESSAEDPALIRELSSRYLAFVSHAFNRNTLRFRNFMTYSRQWLEHQGSEDSQGRALWSLGTVVGRSRDGGRKRLSVDLFRSALPQVVDFKSPRAWAFVLLGIDEYLRAHSSDAEAESLRETLALRLMSAFENNSHIDWGWCEDIVSYDNARLPQALILSGRSMGNAEMTAVGLAALDWLMSIQHSEEGYFSPVGSQGFYRRSGEKPLFDQQPLEAGAMVSSCLAAWRHTGDQRWATEMRRAFRWFLGQNHLQTSLYDPATGGCCDGLHIDRANDNQGAESTLAFLLAHTEMGMLDGEIRLRRSIRPIESTDYKHASPPIVVD